MKQFLKHTGLLLLAFLLIATIVSVGSLWSLSKSTFYKSSFLVNGVSEKKFDYIILGSSVGLTTLNTKVLDSINNTKGINLAMDDTGMSSHYLMLQHFLAEGKKTKYCILAPGVGSLENIKAQSGDNDYRFLMYVNRNYVSDYYNAPINKTTQNRVLSVSNWLPFIGVSFYNTEILFPSIVALLNPKKRNRFDDKGNYTYPKRNKKFPNKDLQIKKLELSHPYLSKIEALCEANDIELIYYFAPMWNQKLDYVNPDFKVIDHTSFLKDPSLFYDDIHVNSVGRKVVSDSFAQEFNAFRKNE